MKYSIDSDSILVELDRSKVVDISPGDELEASTLNASYTWQDQDAQFMESNPDARLFVRFEKISGDTFKGKDLVIVPQETYQK